MSEIKTLEDMRNTVKTIAADCDEGWILGCLDAIEGEIAERFMELPVDADGVPIHVGDVVAAQDEQPFKVRAFQLDVFGWFAIERLGSQWNVNKLHHVKLRTLEDIVIEYRLKAYNLYADSEISGEERVEEFKTLDAEIAAEIRELLGGGRMTATDELRRLLDERGVEYETDDRNGLRETIWCGVAAFQLSPTAKMTMIITPEQAIAATLGSEFNPDGLPVGLTISDDSNLLNWRGENYVRQSALSGGKLTAEQVRDAIRKHAHDDSCYIFEAYGEECDAIADELNAALGRQKVKKVRGMTYDEHGGEIYYLACSGCGDWVDGDLDCIGEHDGPNFCHNCGGEFDGPLLCKWCGNLADMEYGDMCAECYWHEGEGNDER